MKGRFVANLIVSDDAVDIGLLIKSGGGRIKTNKGFWNNSMMRDVTIKKNDSGDFSRYFSLDKWWEQNK